MFVIMKQILLVIFIVLALSAQSFAQIEKLPVDPRIKHGTLDNGLKYYIVKNPAQKGNADFWFIQNYGYLIENKNKAGIDRKSVV